VRGAKLEDLFRNSACALFSILINYKPKKATSEEKVILESETLEELLVTWLNELISLFFAYKFLPAEYSLVIEESQNAKILKALIKGAEFNPYKNKINKEVKAATYHNLKVEKIDKEYVAEIIFDV
jgi:SHS2 domain-containing protein